MNYLAAIILFGSILYCFQEILRRSPTWVSLGTFSLLPLLLTPYWLRIHDSIGWFPWLKLYSIIVSVSWLTALRATALGTVRRPVSGLVFLLGLNIAEALTVDALSGHTPHFLIFISGLLLLATMPASTGAGVCESSGVREFLYPQMSRAWIIEYTVWNWAFLFLNFPVVAGQHVAVLGSSFFIGMTSPSRWLQARGHTLATSLMLTASFPNFFLQAFGTANWQTPSREVIVSTLCVLVSLRTSQCWIQNRMASQNPGSTPADTGSNSGQS